MGLDEVVAAALAEDLGNAGDVTTAATVPSDVDGTAHVVARQPGVVAGVEAIAATFAVLDPRVAVTAHVHDGDRIQGGSRVATLTGSARSLLAGERTALNLVSHLSGVATLTAAYVAAVAGTRCLVRDTRKTVPGLRALQKAAVRAGGGTNHRAGLYDGLLVKDNHAASAGGVGRATKAALAAAGTLSVQVEVDDLDELEEALAAGTRSVLCDNFDLATLGAAVARCRTEAQPVFVEASGGVTLDTAAAVAATGVDAVAVGPLTHSAAALDIGLDFVDGP